MTFFANHFHGITSSSTNPRFVRHGVEWYYALNRVLGGMLDDFDTVGVPSGLTRDQTEGLLAQESRFVTDQVLRKGRWSDDLRPTESPR